MNKDPANKPITDAMRKAEHRSAIQRSWENIDDHAAYQKIKARAYRSMYQALIDEGFSDDQAFALCQQEGWK